MNSVQHTSHHLQHTTNAANGLRSTAVMLPQFVFDKEQKKAPRSFLGPRAMQWMTCHLPMLQSLQPQEFVRVDTCVRQRALALQLLLEEVCKDIQVFDPVSEDQGLVASGRRHTANRNKVMTQPQRRV